MRVVRVIALTAMTAIAASVSGSSSVAQKPPAASHAPGQAGGGSPGTAGYVGEALLRAPLGALPEGDALSAYTRALLAPGFPGLTLRQLSASNAAAFSGEAPGLPRVTLRWWDAAGSGTASLQMYMFERELNGGCVNGGIVAQRVGAGARVIAYSTTCPTTDPPYQLWWLEASDRERSRLLLIATPAPGGAAVLGAGRQVLAALGMPAGAPTATPPASPAPPATVAPRPPAPPPATSREVRTVRGLMRANPFSVTYPANLIQQNGSNSELALSDAAQEFEFTLSVRPATPSLSAAFDARAFGDGVGFLQMLRRSVPGAALVGNAVVSLPAGPAHVVHWSAPANGSTPAMRYIDARVYDGGRGYNLSFVIRESALDRHREAVGFILANFATTSAASACCAASVAVP